jgi:hypothetical protein
MGLGRYLAILVVLSAVGISLLAAVLHVLSQRGLDITYEFTAQVTSTSETTLWTPGTHTYRMTGEGRLTSPFEQAFTFEGNGTATYSCTGAGCPPGQINLVLTFVGDFNSTFLDGQMNVSVVANALTDVIAPTSGYQRTEEVRDLTITGTYNGVGWNSTTDTATVDFASMGGGMDFQIQVQGGAHLSLPEEGDDTPPEVGHPSQDPTPDVEPNQTVTVTANITDADSSVDNATLWHSTTNGTSWMPVEMSEISLGLYQATIPGYPTSTWVTYKISAYDENGNLGTNDNAGSNYLYHVPESRAVIVLSLLAMVALLAVRTRNPRSG